MVTLSPETATLSPETGDFVAVSGDFVAVFGDASKSPFLLTKSPLSATGVDRHLSFYEVVY